jgi:hypothetical protein
LHARPAALCRLIEQRAALAAFVGSPLSKTSLETRGPFSGLPGAFKTRVETLSQQAMAMAMVYPEAEKGGRGKKNSSTVEGFSAGLLSDARLILRESPSPLEQQHSQSGRLYR